MKKFVIAINICTRIVILFTIVSVFCSCNLNGFSVKHDKNEFDSTSQNVLGEPIDTLKEISKDTSMNALGQIIELSNFDLSGEFESKEIKEFKLCSTCVVESLYCNLKINAKNEYELVLLKRTRLDTSEFIDSPVGFPALILYWETGYVTKVYNDAECVCFFLTSSRKSSTDFVLRDEKVYFKYLRDFIEVHFVNDYVVCNRKQ